MNTEQDPPAESENAAPRKRRFTLQWSLQTLLLLMAVVAVWVTYFHFRQQIPHLETRIASMKQMARELIVEDEEQIVVVKLPEMWYDENRWDIHLPQGKFMIRLSTREVDAKGLATVVGEALVGAGRHRIELLQSGDKDRPELTVIVDERPLIEAFETSDWNPHRSSSGGGQFVSCSHLPPDRPVILFRRRFHRPTGNGQSAAPKGPAEGLMLWIERIEAADGVGSASTDS